MVGETQATVISQDRWVDKWVGGYMGSQMNDGLVHE